MRHLHPQISQTKLWAVIPAAGSGSRFSKTELKQYQYIQDRTVLEHTIRRISQLPLNGYVLAIGTQDTFAQTLAFQNMDNAHFCTGGAERVHSVLNALNHLLNFADENDWVLVHDAARPCVTIDCLNALVAKAVESNDSAILAIPVRDTLKQVKTGDHIDKTVSRDSLWQAQTPQITKIGKLKKAIEHALENNVTITDEASALEYMGETVRVVMGRSDNIKITYPDDLELARLILQSQS
ncbi:2-C-methyl-D-erythritol 4-phosphate cytidylyltransferase [Acinetobacter calcoaceticus]|uniref:2-C-methyl-D-erythritol 4-phosphate cytidylyltransferase n=1 Tax=Acinetobacter calcoaceticus TaxID=471 RepID=UPI000373B530|nr:2-C-methyl-D-erythritol 4-phosphate cytidylyltransferase [Acinetobacter calcoaceticus]KJH63046.1 2-C-methyl-D-erythritol 4-phosphate cytidylyltransferase [Acinetobacter calcoaceticus]WNY30355.1 2-C-methyl-D-erythritol 4-phosphate cytidylyltransferase [Acinetobacter calcoaceticus]